MSRNSRISMVQSLARVPAVLDRYLDWFVSQVVAPQLSGVADHRRGKILVVACHAGAAVTAVSICARLALRSIPGPGWLVTTTLVGLVLLLSPFLLRRTHSIRSAAAVPLSALCLAVPVMVVANGGIDAPVIAMIPTVPVIAAFFIGPSGAMLVGVVLAVEVGGAAVASELGWVAPVETPVAVKATLVVAYIGVTVFIARVYERERQGFEKRLGTLTNDLYEASIRDPLTGVFNRRYFAQRLCAELAFAARHDASLSVLILDVDHFKRVNDGYGHQAGDTVLMELAVLLQSELRQEDLVARYGGEEFVLLLRGADMFGAMSVAERVRARVASRRFVHDGQELRVTVSIGCASSIGRTTEDALLGAADARLYRAKESGRNRVIGEVPAADLLFVAGSKQPRALA